MFKIRYEMPLRKVYFTLGNIAADALKPVLKSLDYKTSLKKVKITTLNPISDYSEFVYMLIVVKWRERDLISGVFLSGPRILFAAKRNLEVRPRDPDAGSSVFLYRLMISKFKSFGKYRRPFFFEEDSKSKWIFSKFKTKNQ